MVKYICEGTCGGSVTEEEYKAGNHVCGTKGCTHEGQPLVCKDVGEGGEEPEPIV